MVKNLDLEDVSNNTLYKKRVIIPKLGCTVCKYHRGCNRDYKGETNWKSYRKKQYKS